MARDICSILHGLKPVMVMVLVQVVFAGVNIFYKLAVNDGMNMRILVAYRYIFAAAFLCPLAFFIERKSRPKMTWTVLFQASLCGLFGGTLAQNLYVTSLALTSSTYASAMTNLVPAITFIMALSFGMERLGYRTMAGQAKVVGTLIGISGAMVLTFYKGADINIWSTKLDLLHHQQQQEVGGHGEASHGNRVLGSLLAIGSCVAYAIWLIIQAKMSERYPCHYSTTALMCLAGAIQAVLFALCMERDWSEWKLGWNIRLLTVAYSGIAASGMIVTLIAWCVAIKGPLYASVFNPLMLVLVAIMGSILVDEKLHMGTIIGAIFIIIGLYVVLWGKGKEMKRMAQLMPSKSSREQENIEVVILSSSNNNAAGSDLNNNEIVRFSASNTDSESKHSSIQEPEAEKVFDEKNNINNFGA